MAFKKSKSRKCPACVSCTTEKLKQVNAALAPILGDVKATGEIPKAQDKRFMVISHSLMISPYALQYHLKSCLVDLEIQDQRLIELKDLASAISTAKAEYMGTPNMGNAQAYTSLMNTFMSLAKDIEGQDDPEEAVRFIAETVVASLSRKVLAAVAEESRSLRETMKTLVSAHQGVYVKSQIDSAVQRVGSQLQAAMDESLKHLTTYYRVELEAKERKHMLESGRSPDDTSEEERVH